MVTTPSSPESFPVIFMLDTVVMGTRMYYEELILSVYSIINRDEKLFL